MSLSLSHIITVLCPDYKFVCEENVIKKEIIIDKTSIKAKTTYIQMLSCILFNFKSEPYDLETELQKINDTLEKYIFNDMFNIKKVIVSIEQNIVNNDVLLFLSAYYNINIYVYNEICKILKIYYIEDLLYTTKKCILLVVNEDNDYQTTNVSINDDYSYFNKTFPNILQVAIGLQNNKILEMSDNEIIPVNFIIGKINDNKIIINEMFMSDIENSNLKSNLLDVHVDKYSAFLLLMKDSVSKLRKIRIIKSEL